MNDVEVVSVQGETMQGRGGDPRECHTTTLIGQYGASKQEVTAYIVTPLVGAGGEVHTPTKLDELASAYCSQQRTVRLTMVECLAAAEDAAVGLVEWADRVIHGSDDGRLRNREDRPQTGFVDNFGD